MNIIPSGDGTLSGWGTTGGVGRPSNILQKVILPTIDIGTCRGAIEGLGLPGSWIDNTNFCTGPLTGGMSACQGKLAFN